jgi:putative DNA primase/helicase
MFGLNTTQDSLHGQPQPVQAGPLPGGGAPNHIEITGFLEDALPVIRERLGGAPKSLHETGGEPITFDTHTKGKQSGWAYVSRKPDGWLLTCGDTRSGVQYTIFVRGALTAGVAPDILLPASRQKDDGAAERAAQKADALYKLACPAGDDHPYLVRKGVKPTDTLCELHVGRIREIIGYHPHAGNEPLEGRILIAPVVIGDKISTVEFIDEQGRKSALKDGRKSGGFWATGTLPETGRLILAEGVATALSIAEALGEPVVAALSVNNFGKVGRALQRPGRELVIAADLGEGGKPHSDAIEAARKLGARLCAPPSDMGKGADFNDLHVRDGLDAVRAAFERPIPAVELAGQDAGGTPLSVVDEHPLPPEQPFPVEALPELIREAVQEVQDYTQAPTALVAASALTAVSIAVQGLADVEINWMMRRPISLFLLTIAESGERKTTCDRYFTKPLREFEREAAKKAALELVDYSARMAAWEARREGLLKAIQKAGRDGIELGSSLDEQALIKLQHQMPEKPPVPQLLYTDATTEALAYSLTHSWPSAGLVSSEAGAVFGGYSMSTDTVVRNLALLNQLWDGADFSVDRRTKESFHVRNVRLTIGLQVQPAVMHKFMDGHGAVSRGQGFLARCLLSSPKSTQGTRIAKDPPSRTPGLDAFCQRLRNLLEMPLPRNKEKELEPPALYLAPKAHECWKDYANRTERRLQGDLQGLRDVGSKAAENAARLAAVMHMFEQGDAARGIGEEYIERAARIVDWYLLEARRFFEESTGAIDLSDAARLKRWLREYCTTHKTGHVTCRNARNYGPIKDGKRFFAAASQLEENGDAWVQKDGRRQLLCINPTLLHPTLSYTPAITPAMSDGGETASVGSVGRSVGSVGSVVSVGRSIGYVGSVGSVGSVGWGGKRKNAQHE